VVGATDERAIMETLTNLGEDVFPLGFVEETKEEERVLLSVSSP